MSKIDKPIQGRRFVDTTYKCKNNDFLNKNDHKKCKDCEQGPRGPQGPQGFQGLPRTSQDLQDLREKLDPRTTKEKLGPQGPGGALAYGSLYNPSGKFCPSISGKSSCSGQKVVFTTPGPLLGTAPLPPGPGPYTDIEVLTAGVYEISMDLTARLINASNLTFNTEVQFRLFINDTTPVLESTFESFNRISGGPRGQPSQVETRNTIGRTIQLSIIRKR
ncbi:hypothetical protein RCO48_27825 [Peribacillus frigoritolerans]|nr:hypothetical protein [Peribacillus frigoritolerans]